MSDEVPQASTVTTLSAYYLVQHTSGFAHAHSQPGTVFPNPNLFPP